MVNNTYADAVANTYEVVKRSAGHDTIMVLLSVALIIIVLMQKSTGEDMSAIAGYNQKNESFFGKNKSQTSEGKLRKATIAISVLLLIVSIVYFIILSLTGVSGS